MKRVAVYIDGSNFYFSVKKRFNCKIDIEKFCRKLAGKNKLVKINYYIAPVGLNPTKMYVEQQRFFENLKKIENLKIIFGRLEKRKRDGKIYFIEKATDINFALDLVLDAQADVYDEAFIISNDGDFSEAINAAINRFGKRIIYVAIGNRKMISYHLKNIATKTEITNENFIEDIKL